RADGARALRRRRAADGGRDRRLRAAGPRRRREGRARARALHRAWPRLQLAAPLPEREPRGAAGRAGPARRDPGAARAPLAAGRQRERMSRRAGAALSSGAARWQDRPPASASPPPATSAPVTLRLDQLEKRPLAGEGNFVWKIPFAGGHEGAAVLKVYYGSRGWPLYLKKTVGNRLLTGRTSQMPRARFRHETEGLRLWESPGFR